MCEPELTYIQKKEREALIEAAPYNRATLEIVGALRKYRQTCEWLKKQVHRDGEINAVDQFEFFSKIEEIEEGPEDFDD